MFTIDTLVQAAEEREAERRQAQQDFEQQRKQEQAETRILVLRQQIVAVFGAEWQACEIVYDHDAGFAYANFSYRGLMYRLRQVRDGAAHAWRVAWDHLPFYSRDVQDCTPSGAITHAVLLAVKDLHDEFIGKSPANF